MPACFKGCTGAKCMKRYEVLPSGMRFGKIAWAKMATDGDGNDVDDGGDNGDDGGVKQETRKKVRHQIDDPQHQIDDPQY